MGKVKSGRSGRRPYAFVVFLAGAFLTALAAGAAFSGGGMMTLR
jgi:hypothetical protein